jgi:hypothetical protein
VLSKEPLVTASRHISDLPTVEQRATAIGLRQLLRRLGAHGPPPVPATATSLPEQIPLLPSRTLWEAVTRGFEVLSNAGLHGRSLRDLGPNERHWHVVSTLALDELGRREARALEELAAHPPAHLVAAIGRPGLDAFADHNAARGSWATVASQVMAYRLQYAITDPTRALGASPLRGGGVARETDWRMVMGEIRWSPGNLGEHLIDPRVLGVFDATGRVDPQLALQTLHDGASGRADPGDGRQQRIRAAPSHALRRRVSEALGLIRQRPVDRSMELERWATARDAAAVLYQHRPGASSPSQQGDSPQQPSRRLQELDGAIARVRRAQDQRLAWDARYADKLTIGRLAAEELVQRESEALLALEVDPPEYLVAELGRPPSGPAGLKAWQQAARLIERYRARHEIGDQARPFGRRRDAKQQADLSLVRQQLERLRDGLCIVGPDLPALPAPPSGLTRDP